MALLGDFSRNYDLKQKEIAQFSAKKQEVKAVCANQWREKQGSYLK